jgi:transcriptional regulator with XRE-family HTH domain
MARAALGLGVRELAVLAKVSVDTVARFERGDELKERTVEALQRALETAGVEFTNGDKPGVRLSSLKPVGLPKVAKPQKLKSSKGVQRAKASQRRRRDQ